MSNSARSERCLYRCLYKCPQTYTRPFQKKKKKEAKRDRRLLYYVCFSWSSYCGVSCPVCDGADAGPRKVAARPVATASREYLVVVRSAVLRSAVLRSGSSRYYVYGVGTYKPEVQGRAVWQARYLLGSTVVLYYAPPVQACQRTVCHFPAVPSKVVKVESCSCSG